MPAIDSQEFRTAMAMVPTAVTVVTAATANGPAGATANAVASLSLDPPLMLVCLDRRSRTLDALRGAERFAINVLDAGSEEVARGFASATPHSEKWAGVEAIEAGGIPVIERALIWVTCELRDLHDGGDHVIVTGSVLELESREGDPLLFWGGRYHGPPQGREAAG